MIKTDEDIIVDPALLDLFTPRQIKQMFENAESGIRDNCLPVALLIATENDRKWLVSEIDPNNNFIGYGLYQTDNAVFLGDIDISEIIELRNSGVAIFNSKGFKTEYKLAIFQEVSKSIGKILAPTDMFNKEYQEAFNRLSNK